MSMLVKMSSNLKQRLKISSLAIPLLFITLYLSIYPVFMTFFVVAVTGIIAAAVWEFYHLAEEKGLHPMTLLGLSCTVAYAISTFLQNQFPMAKLLPFIVMGISLGLIFLSAFIKGSSPIVTLSVTTFGLIYLAVPLSLFISINFFFPLADIQDGRWWLLYLLFTTKMTDTGAFAIGKLYGKTPLAPFISPRKTWEGALGGLIIGTLTSIFFMLLVQAFSSKPPIALTFIQSIWLGFGLSIVAQFGDLAESLIKRDAGVKDSFHLPGLGGVLDIVDSLVFATPLLYLVMYLNN